MVNLGKKGGFADFFLFIILSFVFVLIFAIFIFMASETRSQLHTTMDDMDFGDQVNTSTTIDQTFGEVDTSVQALYWLAILLIIGMIVSILIGSYLVTTKPVFLVPYTFIVIIAVFFSVVISNAYGTVIDNSPQLASTLLNFVGANFILSKLPIWVSIIAFVGAIIMFSRMGSKEETIYHG